MKKALMIIDYQNDLVDPEGAVYIQGAETIKPYILMLINEFNAHRRPIIGVQIEFNEELFATLQNHNPQLQECFMAGSWGQQWAIDTHLFTKTFTKSDQLLAGATSPFYHPDGIAKSALHQYLQAEAITDVVVCGVRLDLGVSTAARDLVRLGYNATIDLKASFSEQEIVNLSR